MRNFVEAMQAAGLAMHKADPIADGRLHRYRVEGDKAGSKNGWYVLHLDDKPFGAFGSWRTGQSETWTASAIQAMTDAERQAMALRMAAAKAARDAEQRAVNAAARERAAKLWGRATRPAGNDHPYLVRKHVGAFGIPDLRGQLVIPMRDVDGALHSLQFIGPDGRKTFLTGGRKRGCYYAIGRPDDALCICEGYATGATIFQETGHATVVAFDAGNLQPVAEALRRKFPALTLVIAADNDSETAGNPGIAAARAAARAAGAVVAVPSFGGGAHV